MIKRFYISQPHLKKNNHNYFGICKLGGKKLWEISLATTKKKKALDWKAKKEAEQFFPEKNKDLIQKPINEAVKEFRKHMEITLKKQHRTWLAYNQYLNKFAVYLSKEKKPVFVHEFSLKNAQDYIDYLSKDMAPKTVSEHRKLVKKAFIQWQAFNYTDNNPFSSANLTLPKIGMKLEKPFWLLEEIEHVLSLAPAYFFPFWATLAHTGIRFQEALDLTVDNIDMAKAEITVHGKGRKTRIVPINSLLLPILTEQIKTVRSGRCFPLIPSTEQGCLKVMKKALKGVHFAKEGECNHHRFRHSFASNLLRGGASIKQVQLLLGHSDIRTTLDIYGHLLPEDLHKAVRLLIMPQKSKCLAFKKGSPKAA